ncbi:MAG: hypothetical protein ACRDRY_19485 [Pseudonocardiaceae bacterium]
MTAGDELPPPPEGLPRPQAEADLAAFTAAMREFKDLCGLKGSAFGYSDSTVSGYLNSYDVPSVRFVGEFVSRCAEKWNQLYPDKTVDVAAEVRYWQRVRRRIDPEARRVRNAAPQQEPPSGQQEPPSGQPASEDTTGEGRVWKVLRGAAFLIGGAVTALATAHTVKKSQINTRPPPQTGGTWRPQPVRMPRRNDPPNT